MKAKSIIPLWIFAVITFVISLSALIVAVFPKKTVQDAQTIYAQSVGSIVEVKSYSDGIGESFGTGVLFSSDGTLVTNAHVVTYTRLGLSNAFADHFIRFSFEEEYRQAELVSYDVDSDIAILRITETENATIHPIKMGNSDGLKAGDTVYAVGNASNYGIGIFSGIISVPLVNIVLDNVTRSVIQCDLTIAAGNSGGALLDENGNLIGITTFRTKDNAGNVIYGIVYCIPIDRIKAYINA